MPCTCYSEKLNVPVLKINGARYNGERILAIAGARFNKGEILLQFAEGLGFWCFSRYNEGFHVLTGQHALCNGHLPVIAGKTNC